MSYTDFYNKVETITLFDPLSDLLGSIDDGMLTFDYMSIVKNAGHSCPTVAGAYLMTLKALKSLYGKEIPVRGEIRVEFKESIEEGVAGVISNVISNITGATRITGFKGLGGKFARHSLIDFDSKIESSARFIRIDTGLAVDVYYNPSKVGVNPLMPELMQAVVSSNANKDEKSSFIQMWQKRVKEILIDNFNNSDVIKTELLER